MIKRTGFTLIELLMTMGIVAIIAAISVPAYGAMRHSVGLNGITRQLVGTLREAQSKSITSQENAQFGVRFDGSSYTLFRVNPAHDVRTTTTDVAISAPTTVIFTRFSGQTAPTSIVLGSGHTTTITISANGLITSS